MKKSFFVVGLGVLTAISIATSVKADERWPRWYIGLTGDYTYMSDQDVSGGSASNLQLNDGWGIGGSIGYLPSSSIPIINSLRFEAEVTYHENQISKLGHNGAAATSGTGNYEATAYMANMFYDLQTGTQWTPYIGGGLGFATVHLPTGLVGNTNDSDNEFAYQGMIGVGYTPDTIPDTQWTLGYRYLATDDPKYSGASTEYSTHNIEIGAKFRF